MFYICDKGRTYVLICCFQDVLKWNSEKRKDNTVVQWMSLHWNSFLNQKQFPFLCEKSVVILLVLVAYPRNLLWHVANSFNSVLFHSDDILSNMYVRFLFPVDKKSAPMFSIGITESEIPSSNWCTFIRTK